MKKIDFLSSIIIVTLWGVSFMIAKIGVSELTPLMLTSGRFFVAGLILIPFAKFPKKEIKRIVAISMAIGVEISCFYTGAKYIDAGAVVIAVQTGVPISTLLAVIFFREKIGLKTIAGLVISFAGIVYLSGSPRVTSVLPILIIIFGAFSWSIANILTKKIDKLSPVTLNGYISFITGIIFLFLSLTFEQNPLENLLSSTVKGWGAMIALAVLVSVLSDTLWYRLLCKYRVSQVVPFTLLAPVVGVIASTIFLKEPITSYKITGGLMVVLGVAIIEIRKIQKRKLNEA